MAASRDQPSLELHANPEVIFFKIHELDLDLLVTTEPYDWGGIAKTFFNLNDFDNYVHQCGVVVSAFLTYVGSPTLKGRYGPIDWVTSIKDEPPVQPDVAELSLTGRFGPASLATLHERLTLYELWFDRIPNVINESLGIHPEGRVGDSIGSVARYYAEYYVPAKPKTRYSSSLLASAYLVADLAWEPFMAYLEQIMTVIMNLEFENRLKLLHSRNCFAYLNSVKLRVPDVFNPSVKAPYDKVVLGHTNEFNPLVGSVSIIGSDEPSSDGVSSIWEEFLDGHHRVALLDNNPEIAHLGVMRWLGDLGMNP